MYIGWSAITILSSQSVTYPEWVIWGLAIIGAIITGMAKGGIKGIGIIIVTIFALAYGGKPSTAILVPLLITGDIMAVIYYNRHTQWKHLAYLLPWVIIGIGLGVLLGKNLPEHLFRQVMAFIILIGVVLMFWWDRRPLKYVPDNWWFAGILGVITGFTTMIGNLAGPFANIFFLAIRLPKNQFIGTAAWLFFIVNLLKLPVHLFYWNTLTVEALFINLKLVLFVILGFWAGVKLVNILREKDFRTIILLLTAIGAVIIFLR